MTLDYTLYLIVSSGMTGGRSLLKVLSEAVDGGVTLVQLREKELDSNAYLTLAKSVKRFLDKHGIPLIINDNVEVAGGCGAAGVHLGQEDASMTYAREKLGGHALIGVSAHSVAEAVSAEKNGADYLGVGTVFPTTSKSDIRGVIGVTGLSEVCAAVSIPVVGIGGINARNAGAVIGAGAAGICVISGILSHDDIGAAASSLLDICRRAKENG